MLHEVTHQVLSKSRVIDEGFTDKHLSVRESLVVVDHARFQIVVAHEVGHITNLVLESLLTSDHCRTSRVETLHDGVQFLSSLHPNIVFVPSFLHLVADAPDDDGRVVAVSQHHVGDVLVGVLVIEWPIIARFPFVESLVEYQQTEGVADVQELW